MFQIARHRWWLLSLAAWSWAAAGCALWKPAGGDQPLAGAGPPGDVIPASYEENQPDDALKLSDFAPENFGKTAKKLTGNGPNRERARELYQAADAEYRQAATLSGNERQAAFEAAAAKFVEAAGNWPNSALEQDSLFMAGEAQFFADRYPQAIEQYERLIKAHPNNRHMDIVDRRRFTIAKYWLEVNQESPDAWYAFNFTNPSRPWRDTRGNGLRIFDRMRIDDPTGRLADDATLAAANERFRQGEWMKAEDYYADLRKNYPTSEHQFDAHFLGLKAKLQSYQGEEYAGAALDEAEKLVKQIRRQFPQQATQEKAFLDTAWAEVRYKKAERQWHRGAYYDRRGEYRAASIYYTTIVKEFNDTPFSERAEARLREVASLPPTPPQQMQWLVNLFPESDRVKPLLKASQQTGN